MRVKVRQVGNSITVTIPKEIALDLGITPEMEMDLTVRDHAVVMQPTQTRWERLLADARRHAVERGLSEADIDLAIAESRGRSA
jgi:antitoxin component of MazEF toxin-antitoxin module